MFGDHVTAARADLEFYVPVGETRADLAKVREEYDRTIGQMSTATLRQHAAEEKLNRALANGTVNSDRVVRATVAYRREMQALEAETRRGSSAITNEQHSVERFGRGLLAGTGVLGGFRRAVFFASSSLLGGFGLTYAIRSTVDAAEAQQVALAHIQVALQDTGKRWADYRGQIEGALNAQVKATGFTDNELAESLAGFVRRFGDVDQALRANAIAADVARAKNISLADAQTLIMRASFGNPRSLRILGIELKKTTSNYDTLIASNKKATVAQKDAAKAADQQATELAALDVVNRKYQGNAARFLQTTAGKAAQFNAELHMTKATIGAALLPTLDRYLVKGAAWLSQTRNQHRLQRDVNSIVRVAAADLQLFGNAAHNASLLLTPLNRLLGGTLRTVQLLTAAFIAFKMRGATAFVIGIREAEAAAGGGALAGAAAGAGSSVVARVAAYTGAGAVASRLPSAGGSLLGRIGLASFAFASVQPQAQHLGGPLDVSVAPLGGGRAFLTYRDPVSGKTHTLNVHVGDNIADRIRADLKTRYPGLTSQPAPTERRGLDSPTRQFGGTSSPTPRHRPAGARFTDLIPASIQVELAKAEYAGDKRAQRQALRDEEAALLRDLRLAHTDAQRADIYQQLAGVKGQIDSLDAAGSRTRRAQQSAAQRRAAGAFRALESKLRANEDRATAADTRTSRRTGITTHAAEIRADRREATDLRAFVRDHHNELKLRQEANARLAQLEKHLAKIEKNTSTNAFAKQAQAFLEALSGEIRQYAPNIEQNFHHDKPAEDPHAAAKQQRKAAAAAFN